MKRFKTLLALTLMLLMTDAVADTDLNFRGTLITEPCTLTEQSEDQSVDFGDIASSTFLSHNRSTPRSFEIKLSNCDLTVGTSVAVTFSGETDDTQPDTFAVTGGAAGVAIALETKEGVKVIPGEAASPVALNENEIVLGYKAYVQSNLALAVNEGNFQSVITFSLQYE